MIRSWHSERCEQGRGVWSVEVRATCPCLILDGEMPAADLMERIKALGMDTDRVCPLYLYSDALANQYGVPRAHLANESWRQKMKSILLGKGVKLWVVDNISSLSGGLKEKDKEDWDPVNEWLLGLRFSGIATILLHHLGKGGGQRGTSSREDNVDTSIKLRAPSDYSREDGCRFICSFDKGRVSVSGLSLIADMEFKLMQEPSGAYVWTWGSVKKEMRRAVLELKDKGMDQQAIGEALGKSKGYISKIVTAAVQDGLLTKDGTLSQKGYALLYGVQNDGEN